MKNNKFLILAGVLGLLACGAFAVPAIDVSPMYTAVSDEIKANMVAGITGLGLIFAISVGVPWLMKLGRRAAR